MNKLTIFSRAIFAIAIMLMVGFPSLAHDFEVDGIYYKYLDETAKTVKVTFRGSYYYSYSNEYTGSVTIPSSVTYSGTTYSVTSIGDRAFYECSGLTSVTIPNSVTSIGRSAFEDCTGLTSVTISNSVTTIGYSTFAGCTSLTSVTIPNSVTSIGSFAFYYCSDLTSITIPNSVTSIGESAFEDCSGLASVTIGNSVTSIGSYAFFDCTGLTEVNISDLSAWCKIDFGVSYANPLYYAKKLKLNGAEIKDLVIPNDITEIKQYAFYWCTGLTSVTIGNSVTSIGDYAFYGCTGLTSVTIGNSVTSIGDAAFYKCTGLTEVNISDLLAWSKIDFSNSGANPLHYAKKLKLNGAEIKDLVIPNDITEIKNYAFYGCTGLTSITIPNSVTTIGKYAFYECTGLTSVTIGNSVTSIGDKAFRGCSGLTSVTIPNSVTTIGKYAFEYCSGLTKVILEDGAESISGLSFPNSIKTLYLGRNTSDKFWNGNLKEITIGNSVTSIVDWAFSYCSGLTSLTIGNSVTSIGKDAFVYCNGLTEVNISDLSAWCKIDFSNSGANPLSNEPKLKLNGSEINDLVIPNDITKIKNYAFYECRGLTSVTIGNSVTTIGDYAFTDCWNMEAIVSLNPTPPVCSSSSSFDDYSCTLYVPKDSYAKYCFDSVWKLFNRIKKIEILASSITLNNSSIELDKGSTATLSATIDPINATIKNIVWTSSNPQIAKVDQSGKITALSAGTATITATAVDGSDISASCNVVVNSVETKITLSQTEANLPVNDVMTLSYAVIPLTTPVEWSTSNENVAYIKKNADNSVMVVGVADGVAIITVKALDGSGVSASCVVTVGVGGVEGVEMDNNAIEVARYDIHGRLLSEPTPGINIVKYSDGTTRKEIVKN